MESLEKLQRGIVLTSRLFYTLRKLGLVKEVDYLSLAIHRDDDIVRLWRYARKHS